MKSGSSLNCNHFDDSLTLRLVAPSGHSKFSVQCFSPEAYEIPISFSCTFVVLSMLTSLTTMVVQGKHHTCSTSAC